MHHSPTRRVFSGTWLELMTRSATIRYLAHSASSTAVIYGSVEKIMQRKRKSSLFQSSNKARAMKVAIHLPT
ncbi:hypothetical protein TNCV_2839251 [Trichonephila clavipes]|nr:hypothetical protein TNCV_2839251 [Trichonephila clavipes]